MIKRFILALAALAVVFGGLAWYQFQFKPATEARSAAGKPPPVVTVSAEEAKTQSWQPHLSSVGSFQAVKGVAIAPEVSGVVTEIRFTSGQEMQEGALLVKLDDSVEQADLKSNQAMLISANLALERGIELYKKRDFPKANLDEVQAERDRIAAQVERDRALITQKTIRAPFTGRLGIRQVNLGQYLSAGTPIVSLQSLDPIYVNFSLPEQDLDDITVEQPVEVDVDAFADRVFRGKITSIDAQVNQETRNILVQATLTNPDHKLLPGMFANVRVLLPPKPATVTVPETAVTYSLYGDSVFVVIPSGDGHGEDDKPVLVADRRFVRVGDSRAGEVQILEGLKAGERVVTSGQIKLRDGSRVQINNSVALAPRKELPKQ